MKAYTLVGQNGNAFFLMGYASNAMKDAYREARKKNDKKGMATFSESARQEMLDEARLSGYDNLVCVLEKWMQKINEHFQLEQVSC